MFFGPWPPRYKQPNFDGVIYTHYAAPPYSARSSAIYLLPFGKVWLGSVCHVQHLEAKQNNLSTWSRAQPRFKNLGVHPPLPPFLPSSPSPLFRFPETHTLKPARGIWGAKSPAAKWFWCILR